MVSASFNKSLKQQRRPLPSLLSLSFFYGVKISGLTRCNLVNTTFIQFADLKFLSCVDVFPNTSDCEKKGLRAIQVLKIIGGKDTGSEDHRWEGYRF